MLQFQFHKISKQAGGLIRVMCLLSNGIIRVLNMTMSLIIMLCCKSLM